MPTITFHTGILTYSIAAVGFTILSLLLISSWRGRLQGGWLVLASGVTALWAALMAYEASHSVFPDTLVTDIMEILRSAGWFGFLIVLLGSRQPHGESWHVLRPWIRNLAGICAGLIALSLFAHAGNSPLNQLAEWWGISLGRVALAVAGMVLVEQLYHSAHPQQRWSIKFLCVGVGGMFAYDFYLYANAMLLRHVDVDLWTARGIINALIVPLIAVSAARNPTWSLEVFVSRRLLFQSSALFGAGLYLMLMAAAGYYIRVFGGGWGSMLQITFLFGAVLLLFIMLFSGTMRARLKMFLSRHFFNYHYDYREEWLKLTQTLSEGRPGVPLSERAVQAIATLVESPGGGLWLSAKPGLFERAAHWNMSGASGSEKSEDAFCQFLQTTQRVISLDEHAEKTGQYTELPSLPGWLRAIPNGWLVVPLIHQDRLLGFIVLARSLTRIAVNWETRDLLKTAGRQVASYLAQIEAADALVVARQFESFNRMSAFVVHDLKNVVSQLSLLSSNAEKHRHKPAFQQDMLDTVEHSVTKMKGLLMQLRPGGTLHERAMPLLLGELVQRAVAAKGNHTPVPSLEIHATGLEVFGQRERLERVIGHLIMNAIEATPAQGSVLVKLMGRTCFAHIEIIDTGCGMSEDFMRDRLFRPFESGKSSGMGVGAYESREYVHELGGEVAVESREGEGTLFRLILPLYDAQQIEDGEGNDSR